MNETVERVHTPADHSRLPACTIFLWEFSAGKLEDLHPNIQQRETVTEAITELSAITHRRCLFADSIQQMHLLRNTST